MTIESTLQKKGAVKESEISDLVEFLVVPDNSEKIAPAFQASDNKSLQVALRIDWGSATELILKSKSLVQLAPNEWGEMVSLEDDGTNLVAKRRPIQITPAELPQGQWYVLPSLVVRNKHGLQFTYQFDAVNASTKFGLRIIGGF